MKKYIRLFLIAMAVLFVMPNVYAREFTIDGTNYTIDGIKVNLYEVTFDNGAIAKPGLVKYVSKEPTKTVTIDISKLSYHPKYKTIQITNTETIGGEWAVNKHHLIDLDFNISKEDMTRQLASEMAETTAEKAYLFDVVFDMKFTAIPDKVKTMGLLDGSVRSDAAEMAEISGYTGMKVLDTTKSLEYVFNGGYLVNNNIQFETKFYDNTQPQSGDADGFSTLEGENFRAIAFADFLDIRDAEDKNIYGISFMDLDDFDDFVNYQADGVGTVTDSGDVKEVTYDVIPVPNTALDFSKVIYIAGYLLIIGGAYLLLRFKTKKGSN